MPLFWHGMKQANRTMDRMNKAKKTTAILLLAVFLCLFALAGCTKQPNTGNEGEGGKTGLANPMVEYESLSEINKAAGTALAKADGTVTDEAYFVIGETLADYRFTADGVDYTYRGSKRKDDISGLWVDGKTVFANEEPGADPVIFAGDGFVTMRWFADSVQYVLTARGDGVTFDAVSDRMFGFVAETVPDGPAYRALEGTYGEANGLRYALYAGYTGTAVRIIVFRSDSETEATYWTMQCRFDDGGRLAYADCRCVNESVDADGNYSDAVVYENGEGFFTVENGSLLWTGAADEENKPCIFERVTE